jgi:hypothetical protein
VPKASSRWVQNPRKLSSHNLLDDPIKRTLYPLAPCPAAGAELGHVSVYPLHPVVVSYTDAVVAIQDEVEVPYLVEA